MNEPRHLPKPNPQVLFTELDDGTGVLLHLDTKFYYALNTTAVVVWKSLGEALPHQSAIATRIAEQFKVEPEIAAKDVARVIEEMLDDGLVLRDP